MVNVYSINSSLVVPSISTGTSLEIICAVKTPSILVLKNIRLKSVRLRSYCPYNKISAR